MLRILRAGGSIKGEILHCGVSRVPVPAATDRHGNETKGQHITDQQQIWNTTLNPALISISVSLPPLFFWTMCNETDTRHHQKGKMQAGEKHLSQKILTKHTGGSSHSSPHQSNGPAHLCLH